MNIIHICCVYANKPNGIKTVLDKLPVKQREIGNKVRVFSLREVGDLDFKHVNTIRKFICELNNDRPDIVIFHSIYYVQYIPYVIILRQKNIPYIIELHGALSIENYKKSHIKKVICNFLFYNKFIKQAKTIIYLNENEYNNSIVKNINPNHIIIPNGCDTVHKLLNTDKAINIKIEIIYIGRIEKTHKGLDLLLDAIEIIANGKMKNKVHFVFYGDGHENECNWFTNKILNLSQIAEYRGPVYGKQKELAMINADIFILTSRYEGMPMGILEALANGLPCILTSETNLGDEVENAGAGWLTSIEPKHIANTIEQAISEYPIMRKELRNNAIALSKKYDWQRIAKNSVNEYRKIINKLN